MRLFRGVVLACGVQGHPSMERGEKMAQTKNYGIFFCQRGRKGIFYKTE